MKRVLLVLLLVTICQPPVTTFAEAPILVIDPQGHSTTITEVIFTPDGNTLISVAADKTIRLWDVETGDLLKTLRGPIGEGPEGMLYDAALSPDGTLLAVGGYGFSGEAPIHIYHVASGEQLGVLKSSTGAIFALAFSPDGALLASGSSDNTIKLWKLPRNRRDFQRSQSLILTGHTGRVSDIAFSPDGNSLVSASYDGTLRLWRLPRNLRNFQHLQEVQSTVMTHNNSTGIYCVAYAPNGQYIVSDSGDHRIILWDNKGNFLKEIDVEEEVCTISFSADSQRIVESGYLGTQTHVYAIPSGKRLMIFPNHTNTVLASAFYGNNLIVTAGGNDNDIYLWDAASGEVKTHITGKGKSVWSVAFAEQRRLAFGITSNYQNDSNRGPLEKTFNFAELSLDQTPPDENTFRRVQPEYHGKILQKTSKYTLHISDDSTITTDESSHNWIRTYTFTKTGGVVVGSSHTLELYTDDGSFLREFTGHTSEIWAVSVSKDDRILASSSYDQTIKLWNLHTGECLATLFVASDNEWVCWTPQGYYAASAGGEKYIGWHINHGMEHAADYYPVSVFRDQYHHPELVKRTIALGSFEQAVATINAESSKDLVVRSAPALPPAFTWLAPQAPTIETTEPHVTIRVAVRSKSAIKTVKILVNGRTQVPDHKLPPTGRDSDVYREIIHEVELTEGRNAIAVFAANQDAEVVSPERVVMYNPPGSKWWKPDLYMISIGISAYPSSIPCLNYADDDAKALSHEFRQQQGTLFKNVHIQELYDDEATRDNIVEALEWLEQHTTQHDVAIIFVAAHGYNEKKKYYLLPVDGDPERLRSTAVDWRDFIEVLGNLQSRVLFFLDTCHSGQLGADLYALRGGAVDNTEAIRELASDENGVVVMAASTGKEWAIELQDQQHGAFTQALLEGLRDGRADLTLDGIVHLRELDHYLSERVKELTKGRQHPTTVKPSTISRFPVMQVN